MVDPQGLRQELINRFAAASTKSLDKYPRKHGVLPV
jgi:hypothetical protein